MFVVGRHDPRWRKANGQLAAPDLALLLSAASQADVVPCERSATSSERAFAAHAFGFEDAATLIDHNIGRRSRLLSVCSL
jgi:hypothetical protein